MRPEKWRQKAAYRRESTEERIVFTLLLVALAGLAGAGTLASLFLARVF